MSRHNCQQMPKNHYCHQSQKLHNCQTAAQPQLLTDVEAQLLRPVNEVICFSQQLMTFLLSHQPQFCKIASHVATFLSRKKMVTWLLVKVVEQHFDRWHFSFLKLHASLNKHPLHETIQTSWTFRLSFFSRHNTSRTKVCNSIPPISCLRHSCRESRFLRSCKTWPLVEILNRATSGSS